jgi:DNA-binding transcriptional LysR family regulator
MNLPLHKLDLNLLLVFRQLLTERNVSRAAETLELSQPAVSNALARLRRQLGDELFVRTPQGMAPTPYAELIAEGLLHALGMVHDTLNQSSAFVPATSNRRFTIGMTDIGEIWFLPRLMALLAEHAPGVTLSTVRNTAVNLREDMEAGKVDLAIGLLPQLKSGFFQRKLLSTRYVCLMRKGHPLDKPRMSLKAFASAEHLMVVSPGTGHGQIDELMQRAGIQRKVRLTVPHFTPVGHLLQATDMLATVTEQLARKCAEPFGLVSVKHPVTLPEVSINLFWHAKAHKDAANQWLRGLIFDTFHQPR